MNSIGIQATIRVALRKESESCRLRSKIQQNLPQLHEKLVLPSENPVSALMSFIVGYVESVPGCLQLVTAVSQRLGVFDYAAPFLHLAEDYFLQPPDELPHNGGLEALLDEAFLALRLLEEVNDHHIRHLQHPLLPLDITEANIIVHHLLGDDFATRLEQLVQFAAAQLLQRDYRYNQQQSDTTAEEAARSLALGKLSHPAVKIRLRPAS